jgi:DNA-directed RNA polymerase subunit RPC12/RpoP
MSKMLSELFLMKKERHIVVLPKNTKPCMALKSESHAPTEEKSYEVINMNQTQQEWKTTETHMDSFIEPCEYYENGICDGCNDTFRDNRFVQCKTCMRYDEAKYEYRQAQWERIAWKYNRKALVAKMEQAGDLPTCNNGKCDMGTNMNDGHYFKLKCNNCKTEYPLKQQLNGIICPKCKQGILYWIPNNQ